MFPKNDNQFKEQKLAKVKGDASKGWELTFDDGWSLHVDADSPVEPKVGMLARQYGKGVGFAVRGLFLDGKQVYYRTESEQKERSEIERYGADATDWLKRWDKGEGVWSIEMGGLGPGYEQCIHITMAEMLRYWLDQKVELEGMDDKDIESLKKRTDAAMHELPVIKNLGLSGAQYGAAMNLAGHFLRKGPRAVMMDDVVKDRHIQVSKNFPG